MSPDVTGRLRLRRTGAPRAPFVLLVVALLGMGLVVLLLVNTAMATGSFKQRSLQQRNDALALQKQQLERSVQGLDTPQQLAAAAAKLGMVPGGDPAFITVKGRKVAVVGSPVAATPPPVPTTSTPAPTNTPAPTKPKPTSKAPAPKAPASKAPASKAPAPKAPASKSPASKVPASNVPTTSKVAASKASASPPPTAPASHRAVTSASTHSKPPAGGGH